VLDIRFGDAVQVGKSAIVSLSFQRILEDIFGFPAKEQILNKLNVIEHEKILAVMQKHLLKQ